MFSEPVPLSVFAGRGGAKVAAAALAQGPAAGRGARCGAGRGAALGGVGRGAGAAAGRARAAPLRAPSHTAHTAHRPIALVPPLHCRHQRPRGSSLARV